jgi:hypothetical protein
MGSKPKVRTPRPIESVEFNVIFTPTVDNSELIMTGTAGSIGAWDLADMGDSDEAPIALAKFNDTDKYPTGVYLLRLKIQITGKVDMGQQILFLDTGEDGMALSSFSGGTVNVPCNKFWTTLFGTKPSHAIVSVVSEKSLMDITEKYSMDKPEYTRVGQSK